MVSRRRFCGIVLAGGSLAVAGRALADAQTVFLPDIRNDVPTPTSTSTRTLTPTQTLRPTRTLVPSRTPLPTRTAVPTLTPTSTLTPSPTARPSLGVSVVHTVWRDEDVRGWYVCGEVVNDTDHNIMAESVWYDLLSGGEYVKRDQRASKLLTGYVHSRQRRPLRPFLLADHDVAAWDSIVWEPNLRTWNGQTVAWPVSDVSVESEDGQIVGRAVVRNPTAREWPPAVGMAARDASGRVVGAGSATVVRPTFVPAGGTAKIAVPLDSWLGKPSWAAISRFEIMAEGWG